MIAIEYIAHKRIEEDGRSTMQTATDHCRRTAQYASSCLQGVKLSEAAYLAGLLHDAGKFKQKFQDYLLKNCGSRGSVNHTFAGCRMLLEHFHNGTAEDHEDVTCELLSYAVGAHHGQFDCVDEERKSGFLYRLRKQDIDYEESRENFLRHCANWSELEQRFESAHRELSPIYKQLMDFAPEDDDTAYAQMMFSIGQLARLLLSAVIEADRRDTAEFMQAAPNNHISQRDGKFWIKYLDFMERKLCSLPQDSEIQHSRSCISELCRAAAERPGGIYRLHVPTGGGKTLSALRYSLAHAARWNKQRIIFVTPLLSILEQNAAVIRDFIGDDSIILEHHSNVVFTENSTDELDLRELAVENWNAPVIITTLVQLLNVMFLGKTSSVRRYHALCNAVVVIDEVQTVPSHMLSLFNTTLNFLSRICGTTFLLCSATQPCFEQAEHPLLLAKDSQLIHPQEVLWKPFRRTALRDAGARKLKDIPAFLMETLRQTDSLLVICNKKSESEFLGRALSTDCVKCFHLSSAMCTAHRRDVLDRMEDALKNINKTGCKVICVSTQVMEAGVDISFGCVVRLAAGMDSIIQSAGRCNRNGESDVPAPVYILSCSDENLGRLREIRDGKQVTLDLLHQFILNPDRFGSDLSSDAAVYWYYQKLFRKQDPGYQQYPTGDGHTLFQMLSSNADFVDYDDPEVIQYAMTQAFKTAGNIFRVLDDSTREVVVAYGSGEALISELAARHSFFTAKDLSDWVRRAKPYTVHLYDYQLNQLTGGYCEYSGILVLKPEYYDFFTGVITKSESAFLEA